MDKATVALEDIALEMDQYVKSRHIGNGVRGKVFRGFNSVTNERVLLRELQLNDAQDGIPANVIREISLLKGIKDKNILSLLDVAISDNGDCICLVYESLDQNLRNILSASSIGSNPDFIKIYLRQILLAVAYLHSYKILHQDLQPENLFIDIDRKILKVADLGLGRALGGSFEINPDQPSTLRYMAPELLFNSKEYSYEIDIWSVGCIFAEMLRREPLFLGLTKFHVQNSIFSVFGIPNEETWPGVNSLCTYLKLYHEVRPQDLRNLLPRLEPAGFDLISKMLCMNPKGRITARDALRHPYFDSIAKRQGDLFSN